MHASNQQVVVVVDDDPALLRSIGRLLRQYGYGSVLLPSAEAFENLHDFGSVVCVLLDINLGDRSGIELRHDLTTAHNSVPVIFMTGNDTPAVRTAAVLSGCLAYLTKPFSARSLMEPLASASAAWP
jgi:FixJ family two-component response regulator